MTATMMDVFFQEYRAQLIIAVKAKPNDYAYAEDFVPTVINRMRQSVTNKETFRAVNKDSIAIRCTCKALAIDFTYKAIDKYLGFTPDPSQY